MGIYLRDKVFWISYMAPGQDGRKVQKKESAGRTKEEAEAFLEKRKREVANHFAGIKNFTAQSSTKLETLFQELEDTYKLRKIKSLKPTLQHMKPVRKALGHLKISAITSDVIKRYQKTRLNQVSTATVDRETEQLRAALKLAQEKMLIPALPKILILTKVNSNARQGFIDPAKFSEVLGYLVEEDFRDLIEFFYFCGMRPTSIGKLTWESYDRANQTLILPAANSKTGKVVVIPIIGDLLTILNRRVARRKLGCNLIFHRDGETITRDAGFRDIFYDDWKQAKLKANLPDRIPYDLRRSAIRNLRAAGVPEQIIMAITGHRTRSTFDRYGIVDERDIRQGLETVATWTRERR